MTDADNKVEINLLSSYVPAKLFWVVRDFKEDLIDESGERRISENEYFDTKLSEFAKSTSRTKKMIREAILNYFTDRELITVARPFENKADLENAIGSPLS